MGSYLCRCISAAEAVDVTYTQAQASTTKTFAGRVKVGPEQI